MIKLLGAGLILAMFSGYAQANPEPFETSLDNPVTEINLDGLTLISENGLPSGEPTKINDHVSKYLFIPTKYVNEAPGKDEVATVLNLITIDGKVGIISSTSDVSDFEKTQALMKEKFGAPLATRAGVRDEKAFKTSVLFCNRPDALPANNVEKCPSSYYEIYGNIDQAYTIIKGTKDEELHRPAMFILSGLTRDAKNYLDSIK